MLDKILFNSREFFFSFVFCPLEIVAVIVLLVVWKGHQGKIKFRISFLLEKMVAVVQQRALKLVPYHPQTRRNTRIRGITITCRCPKATISRTTSTEQKKTAADTIDSLADCD
ncbi:hypothetical protein OIU84_029871 [Salix udensis]|uniref:Uncharacterized protein n=1 Tax=Salix udensis TaxID=889485 RepID=A0AAD6P8S6_9ROSI|nr:hypothetical protein OIU84_029871 [Salix udensis]